MPLAGVLVQYVGWPSVFYIYGKKLNVCMYNVNMPGKNEGKQESRAARSIETLSQHKDVRGIVIE